MTGKEKALFLAYPTVWTFSVVSFWCSGSASDALGFTLLHLYLLHPAAIVGISTAVAWNECSVPPVAADAPDRFGSGLHALRFFYLSSRQYGRLFAPDAARMDHAAGRSGALACGTPSRANPSPFCLWKRLRANRPQERGRALRVPLNRSISFFIVLDEMNSQLKACLRVGKNLIE